MVSSAISSNHSIKTKIILIVSAVSFLALVTFKVASRMYRPELLLLDQQANRDDNRSVGVDSTAQGDDNSLDSNSYFTSMEAEFEWNQFMVRGNNPEMVDQILYIERNRDTGRKLLEMDKTDVEVYRGLRDGDHFTSSS